MTSPQHELPAWINWIQQIVLWAEPNDARRMEVEALWTDYFQLLSQDPNQTALSLAREVIGSATSHVLWRLCFGAPSAAFPSALIALIGLSTGLYAFSPAYALLEVGPTAVLVTLFSFRVGKQLASPGSGKWSTWQWLALSAGAALNGTYYVLSPVVASDPLMGIGLFAISIGFALLARGNSLRKQRLAWTFAASGTMLAAMANLFAILEYADVAAQLVAATLAFLECAVAITILRWARAVGPVAQ